MRSVIYKDYVLLLCPRGLVRHDEDSIAIEEGTDP